MLQERQVVPIGEVTPMNVDVRVIVAAQSPLAAQVAAGKFREDLYDPCLLYARYLARDGSPARGGPFRLGMTSE